MRIEKKQLAKLIAEKSGVDVQNTEVLLEAFFLEMLGNFKTQKNYSLKGFGEFHLNDQGKLVFEPDSVLALELNFEFAGLEPIEVTAAKLEEDLAEPESNAMIEDQDDNLDEVQLNEAFSNLKNEDPLSKDDPFSEMDESEDEFDLSPSLSLSEDEINALELDEESNSWKNEEDDLPASIYGSDNEEDLFDDDLSFEEANKEKAFSKFRSTQEKERKSNLFGIFTTVIAALIIVVATWYFIFPNLTDEKPEEIATNNVVNEVQTELEEQVEEISNISVQDDPEKSIESEQVLEGSNEEVSTEEVVEDVVQQEKEPSSTADMANNEEIFEPLDNAVNPLISEKIDEPTTAIQFGLMGSGIAKIDNSTTIVVHSLTSEKSARQVAQKIADEGYRTVVFKTVINDGREFWRVGIGQFRNFEQAAEVRGTLDGDYGTRSFIAKITF